MPIERRQRPARRWFVVAVTLLLALALSACGGVTPATEPPATPTPTATSVPSTPTPTPSPPTSPIEIPAAGAQVTLPLHILARVGAPGDTVTAVLRWQDGTERNYQYTLLAGEDGKGLLIGTPPWWPDTPPQPKTQPATLEIRAAGGSVLARQTITVLDPSDPGTREIKLFWTVSGTELVQPEMRSIVRTERVGTAAIEALLWGPPPMSQVGFGTAIPTPEQMLSYPGRAPDWGPRVTLLGLTIVDGVATVDLSREMAAYGGGSLRVKLIRDQITQTLKQFPTVHEVRIAIEGRTEGVLEP